ncbi:hypothetical protein U0030_03370 [Brevundimonas bullata]|uniref:hypothetical protein n=1 Tax=Brevundimonas bullata TaxID=13160 RepID=UPI0013B44B91|nr:hypothetical protein [Brevundimonas bullata]WQE37536.1 hypothetical protein U0030_03370 [Brevundimonas bullata]
MIAALLAASLHVAVLDGASDCRPIAGAEALWREDIRYVFIGETHGTTEAPAAFAELVCAALEQGPVTVFGRISGADAADAGRLHGRRQRDGGARRPRRLRVRPLRPP